MRGTTCSLWRAEQADTLNNCSHMFTAQHSSDGVNWQTLQDESSSQVSSVEIPMNETVNIGLAVASDSPTRSAQSRIADVTVTGLVTPEGPFPESTDIGLWGPP